MTVEIYPLLAIAFSNFQPLSIDDPPTTDDSGDIIDVVGRRPVIPILPEVMPEFVYDTGMIDAIMADSIGDLLDELVDTPGQQITFVNGRRGVNPRLIRGFPPEAIERLEVMPSEAAIALGYTSADVVVNIQLKESFSTARAKLGAKGPEAGGRTELDLELDYSTIRGANLARIAGSWKDATPLLEREVGLMTEPAGAPGRSLLPEREEWTVEGGGGFVVPNWAVSGTARHQTQDTTDFLGTTSDLPSDVPLLQRRHSDQSSVTLQAQPELRKWMITLRTQLSSNSTTIETDSVSGDGRVVSSETETDTNSIDISSSIAGRILEVPAGAIILTSRGQYTYTDQATTGEVEDSFQRNSTRFQTSLSAPILPQENDLGIGNVRMSTGLALTSDSVTGNSQSTRISANWQPTSASFVNISREATDTPLSADQLFDPIVETPEQIVFDSLTGESVPVTTLTGGNPDLSQPTTEVITVNSVLRRQRTSPLSLGLRYRQQTENNIPWPVASTTLAAQEAFPSRFERDADGTLRVVDQRPVSIAQRRARDFQTRLTLSLRRRDLSAITLQDVGTILMGGGNGLPTGWRLRFSGSHTYIIDSTEMLASGTPELDLLAGEGITRSGGAPRHRADLNGRFSNGRLRIEGRATYESRYFSGAAETTSRLRYGDDFQVSLASTIDLNEDGEGFFSDWRLEIDANNIFDHQRTIKDTSGNTPDAFAPERRDPLGRHFELSLSKPF